MTETESLIPTISDDTRTRLMLAIAVPPEGETRGLAEVADELGVSTSDIVALLNDPNFTKGLRAITRAQANLALHGDGIKNLIEIARNGDDREKLTAIKFIGQITGDLRLSVHIDHRVTFDDLRKRESNDPLAGLFDIRSEVIEGVIEDE